MLGSMFLGIAVVASAVVGVVGLFEAQEQKPREAQRTPQNPRLAQRSPERPREAQRDPERPRETQRGPERPSRAPGRQRPNFFRFCIESYTNLNTVW